MKLKLIDMLNANDILEKLSIIKFADGVTSYKLLRNIKNISAELTHFYEIKNKLIEQYGNKKNDGSYEVPVSNRDEFMKQLNELLQQEVEINVLTINPEKLSGYSPVDFLAIDWMITLD